MFEHLCIKCSAKYSDEDPDPYYCFPCREQNKIIAQQIDTKLKSVTSNPVKSDYQRYEELRQQSKTPFVNAKYL